MIPDQAFQWSLGLWVVGLPMGSGWGWGSGHRETGISQLGFAASACFLTPQCSIVRVP